MAEELFLPLRAKDYPGLLLRTETSDGALLEAEDCGEQLIGAESYVCLLSFKILKRACFLGIALVTNREHIHDLELNHFITQAQIIFSVTSFCDNV